LPRPERKLTILRLFDSNWETLRTAAEPIGSEAEVALARSRRRGVSEQS
jgi:hypothetical protein